MSARLRRMDWEQLARRGEFGPQEMARLCAVSLRQMERFFARQFRCTPQKWVRDYRLRLAKEFLARDSSTKAVAAELKFSSPAHFCRDFKRLYGVSPGKYVAGLPANFGL